MELIIKGSPILQANMNAQTRFVNNEGGSRSSKTYSIIIKHISLALQGAKMEMTISRRKGTWLRDTAEKDFYDVLRENNLYRSSSHFKGRRMYLLNGSRFSFVGMDEEQKFRGRKQTHLWVNEINDCESTPFQQAVMRTTQQITWDFNPSDEYHWLYDQYIESPTRAPHITTIHSTFMDNPFLDAEVRNELMRLEKEDEEAWRVFGLGLRARAKETIYNPHIVSASLWDDTPDCYGLDFGFNHPNALYGVKDCDKNWLIRKYVHKGNLLNSDLLALMNAHGVKKTVPIYADAARPDIIAEIKNAGYWIIAADKNVKDGIESVKAKPIHITDDSTEGIKQFRNYKWKKIGDMITDEPVKFEDDAPDAVRYAIYNGLKNKQINEPSRRRLITLR